MQITALKVVYGQLFKSYQLFKFQNLTPIYCWKTAKSNDGQKRSPTKMKIEERF